MAQKFEQVLKLQSSFCKNISHKYKQKVTGLIPRSSSPNTEVSLGKMALMAESTVNEWCVTEKVLLIEMLYELQGSLCGASSGPWL